MAKTHDGKGRALLHQVCFPITWLINSLKSISYLVFVQKYDTFFRF